MKKIFLFLILLIIPFMINGKELELEWQKSIGSSASESVKDVLVTDNKESILTFCSSTDIDDFKNIGSSDIYLYKYDQYGNEIWKKQWGGTGDDYVLSTFLTKEEDIIISVSSDSNIEGLKRGSERDAIIIKYDKDGNLIWQNSVPGLEYDVFENIVQLDDGSIVAVGRTKSTNLDDLTISGNFDIILFKYDKDGNEVWKRSFGGSNWEESYDVKVDKNGNILILGFTKSSSIGNLQSHGSIDMFLIKYDKDGNLLWQKLYGGSDSESFSNLLIMSNNDIIVYGGSYSTDIDGLENLGYMDAIILKYNENGNLVWQRSFGGSGRELFYSAIEKDNSIILTGIFESTDIENLENMGGGDSFIINYDHDGKVKWYKNYGSDNTDTFSHIFSLQDKGYVILGRTNSSKFYEIDGNGKWDGLILFFDEDWNMISKHLWGGSENEFMVYFSSLVNDSLFVTTTFFSTNIDNLINKGESDCVLIKYSLTYDIELLNTLNGTASTNQEGNMGIITPIPNEGYEVDKIIVRDVDGNVLDVEVTKMEDGTYSFPLSDDVKIEVLFKEVLSNPKTGVFDYISFILVGLLISFVGYNVINYNNQKFEL